MSIFKETRLRHELTVREMAEIMGVSQALYRMYESGERNPKDLALKKFKDKFVTTNATLNTIETNNTIQPTEIKLTPEGKMKRRQVLGQYNQIPFYDVDFIAGNTMETIDQGAIQPAYFMDVPIFKDCAAFNTYSDSMEPLIQKGSIIFCTLVKDWRDVLEYGQIYAISLHDNRRFLKYIVRHQKEETHFTLASENKHYDPFPVPKDKIKGIWLVHGYMNKRTQ